MTTENLERAWSVYDERRRSWIPVLPSKRNGSEKYILDYWREIHQKAGYVEISTPIMLARHLWETSGHWDHYKENMYTTLIDDEDFAIKPMNCPGGFLYTNQNHVLTVICRFVWVSLVWYIVMKNPDSFTD